MGACSGDPHLCWASRLLGFTSLLLSICSTGVKSSGAHDSGVQDSGAHIPLHGIRGGSVLFHVPKKQEAELEEVTWGFGPESNYRVLLKVRAGGDAPTWVSLQDKYQQRVHVPNMTTLKIENLTSEDSGQYRARSSFTGGLEFNQDFLLTVYEPVPLPQILSKSPSITTGWCNVTLECRASGATEDLKVTWESKGLPRELEQRMTPGPASNSSTLTVSLPLSQPSANLTCVLSNQVDQKTATLDLGKLCVHEPVPLPEILIGSPSITPGLCNVTLECRVTGAREDLKVTWESKGLPRELEWRGTLGPAPNSWTLTVNQPLSQPNASLTCVLSNQVDQKTATLDLEEVCAHNSHEEATAVPLRAIVCGVMVTLLILGGGRYLWKTRGGMVGMAPALEVIALEEDSRSALCMTQEQDCGGTTGTMLVAPTIQS